MSSYDLLRELIDIPSPTGFTQRAADYIFNLLSSWGYKPEFTRKGAVRCSLGSSPTLAIAAHMDTLGAMVSGIQQSGLLSFSPLGGVNLNVVEGEYVRVETLGGKIYTGTILINNPSVHANGDLGKTQRIPKNMHIRLDEKTSSREETLKLAIQNGDIVFFEPRYQELENGYIKSKFLDNKAGCFVLFEIARRLGEAKKEVPVEIFFSSHEEVGHGGSPGFSPSVEELLVIDMGVLGDGLEGSEECCSICAKDSSGPYHYEFRKILTELAREKKIPFKVDVYPYYSSDGSAALRAGHDLRVALIGPGVAASHGTERTHKKALEATIDLCQTYIEKIS